MPFFLSEANQAKIVEVGPDVEQPAGSADTSSTRDESPSSHQKTDDPEPAAGNESLKSGVEPIGQIPSENGSHDDVELPST